jgi:hypothetical protein
MNKNDFYFGVLHPVARALSRLSGKNRPSQQLFKAFIVFYIFLHVAVKV